jgi:hypothetical protein
MSMMKKCVKILLVVVLAVILVVPIRGTTVDPSLELEQIRKFSRPYEFDYVSWTVSAVTRKIQQGQMGIQRWMSPDQGREMVLKYLDLRNQVANLENQLQRILSDPTLENREQAAVPVRDELDIKRNEKLQLAPYVEQIVQSQMNTGLKSLGMSLGGKLIPPVLYQAESASYALIVSPRDEIRQAANIMLVPDLTLDEINQLEIQIEENLNLSALVVGIGGVGLYPSMIIESGSLNWLLHVVGHEWTHNYLTLRPLGVNYFSSPELTTINETIADLSGDAVRDQVFELYYPEYLPSGSGNTLPEDSPDLGRISFQARKESLLESQAFDFREEMHITRLVTDRLLAEGKINEAEQYLENRRQYFWETGIQIRKLNQAYFAFHGSYAAAPGGAAGSEGADLGQQLRDLREKIPDYAEFMRTVAWRWRTDQFQQLFSLDFQYQ